MAKERGKRLTVKEWKTTPDGRNKWVDHVEVYNAKGQLIEEAEYGDFGRHLSWRSEYTYNEKGLIPRYMISNEIVPYEFPQDLEWFNHKIGRAHV